MTHTSPPDRPASPAPPKRRDPKATRDRLVRAALELFTTQGYHSTTTPQIAARAGVAEGTIYRHFDSKEHLLNEIYRAGLRLFASTVKESPPTLHCRERLERIAAAWRDVAVHNPAVVRLVFMSRIGPLLDQKSRDLARDFRAEVEKVIASGKSAGEVRPGSVDVWADVWLELVGLTLERVANRDWTPEHAGVQHVTEAAWRAMGVTGPESRSPPSVTSPPDPQQPIPA
ncbi:MAG TPA: TetR/AcrR family transcriptional regulator [Gemmatimonadales bacterium]|nr:TetR/AcrR family transcriptional regulator [Gemmatimonadales bacterium]